MAITGQQLRELVLNSHSLNTRIGHSLCPRRFRCDRNLDICTCFHPVDFAEASCVGLISSVLKTRLVRGFNHV